MNNLPHCYIKKIDVERCMVLVDLCETADVMSCPFCCYFLDKRNTVITEEIVNTIDVLPEKISLIRIPLLPTPANMHLFNYHGVETIIYNLFKTTNKKQIKYLSKGDTYLKVYFKKDPLFVLPIIMIEIIFMKALNEKSFDELWKTLKAEVLFFTGSVGDIEHNYLYNIEDLKKILLVPLLIGHPEFKLEGVLLNYKLTEEDIFQLNYIHSISVTKLKMDEIINNNQLILFKEQRTCILKEIQDKKNGKLIDETEDDDIDDLPF